MFAIVDQMHLLPVEMRHTMDMVVQRSLTSLYDLLRGLADLTLTPDPDMEVIRAGMYYRITYRNLTLYAKVQDSRFSLCLFVGDHTPVLPDILDWDTLDYPHNPGGTLPSGPKGVPAQILLNNLTRGESGRWSTENCVKFDLTSMASRLLEGVYRTYSS